jgi:glucosamine--fructose-6-phosphate aminotransferase (isomerizing)
MGDAEMEWMGDSLNNDCPVFEGPYLRDILDQPNALTDTLARLEEGKELRSIASRLQLGKFQAIVLTGMGSSFHALYPLNLELINHGFKAWMVEASELVHYQSHLLNRNVLIIAVSQSGRSAEIVRLLRVNRRKATVIAVTNTPDSPLAHGASVSLMTQAGSEFSVSCKTYVTALMALRWLGDILTRSDLSRSRRDLEKASPLASAYLRNWKDHVEELVRALQGVRGIFLVGRGSSLAAVETGALVIKESDHFHAEGMSSAAFRHGPLEMLSDEVFVAVFAGAQRTRKLNVALWQDIRERQGKTELLEEDGEFAPFRLPKAPESVRPILEILPVQMVTLALAALRGREAGRFTYASKVTTTE